jgi:branched-chain amino acid transport system substrate-binding protein
MNRQFKKFGTFVGLAIVSASVSVGLAGCPQTQSGNNGQPNNTTSKTCPKDEVATIDANVPLTGDLSIYGDAIQDGATIAVEDIKKSDPLNASCLKFDWKDNAGNPQTTVTIEQQQYIDPPNIYISGLKPQTMAIKSQIEQKDTPHFVWILDAFINKSSDNNFRVLPNYKQEAQVYLDYVKIKQPKRVAIIYPNLPHAEEQFTQLVIPKLKEMGIKDIYSETYELGTKDYKNIVVKVQTFKPDLIVLNGFPITLVGLVRALRPLNLITDGNTIATYDMIDTAEIISPQEIEGIRVIAPGFITNSNEPKISEWIERFKTKFNRSPRFVDAYAYDMVMIINDAAKRLKQPATTQQWIETIKATKIQCLTGNPDCYFDKDGDLVTPIGVGVFRGGKIVPDNTQVDK